jgi:hypothetical protein
VRRLTTNLAIAAVGLALSAESAAIWGARLGPAGGATRPTQKSKNKHKAERRAAKKKGKK